MLIEDTTYSIENGEKESTGDSTSLFTTSPPKPSVMVGDPFEQQVGGDHYKKMKIQPLEYILANGLGFCEGNIVKYITRYGTKGGVEDIDKVIHYAQLLKAHLETT